MIDIIERDWVTIAISELGKEVIKKQIEECWAKGITLSNSLLAWKELSELVVNFDRTLSVAIWDISEGIESFVGITREKVGPEEFIVDYLEQVPND